MVTDRPLNWLRFLPWAEYCYNTSYHSEAVDVLLVERDDLMRQLKENLLAAKNRMEVQANRKRRDVEFNVWDRVLVKL
ncbi:hypothetical protein Tco_0652074 [Tanacetum coccineum]|uniref:Uncharacterized protein n=1 Tax=Tanacetum coccineum TaxID=301880 RepID=A0ABQ4WWX9_9ASTR